MTATNQNFGTYAGDAVSPTFTILDANGNPIPLSGVQEILWDARRTPADTAVITKTKTGGGIVFVTDGNDGQFRVLILSADTSPLTGFFQHRVVITDAFGDISTDATGRMQVGIKPTWTYSGDPSNSPRDAVRNWIGDTDVSNQQLLDPEIDYVLTLFTNPLLAAGQCARTLAARYSRKVNKRVGDLAISYSDLAKNYRDLADELEARGNTFGVVPYSGGTSIADMETVNSNTDRPKPDFWKKQFDEPPGGWGPWEPNDGS